MATEHWALLISLIALVASIGIPIWQHRADSLSNRAAKRTLLLQKILSAKSENYLSMRSLDNLVSNFPQYLHPEQLNNLAAMLPRLRKHDADLQNLHEEWSNYDSTPPINEIERTISEIDTALSEAQDTARLIADAWPNANNT